MRLGQSTAADTGASANSRGGCYGFLLAGVTWRVPMLVLLMVQGATADDVHGALDLRDLEYSNLQGLGPMHDVEETLRFRKVVQVDGAEVDMVITADDKYSPLDASLNGPLSQQESTIGAVNLKVGTKANFQVAFFGTGTTTPKAVPMIFFSIFDLERGSSTEEDILRIEGFSAVYLTKQTRLMYEDSPNGTAFMASDEVVGQTIPDPKDSLLLSDEQRAHTATFLFRDTSSFSFTVEFAAPSPTGAGRNLLFGSAANAPSYAIRLPRSYLDNNARKGWRSRGDWARDLSTEEDDADAGTKEDKEPVVFREPGTLESTCSCSLDLTYVKINNLGGLGPDKDAGHMLRYGDVCTVNGRKVDLVVEDMDDYTSTSPEANGRSTCGPYGSISVRVGTMVVLQARFLDSETHAAVTVHDFFFTIFDMDLHGAHKEKVTIHGFDKRFTPSDTMVSQEEVMNGGVFTSSAALQDVECPRDPLALTDEQASVSVTALFRNAGDFSFTLEVEGAETNKSHNFLFGGTSSINGDCSGLGLPTSTLTATTTTATATTLTSSTETITTTVTSTGTSTVSTTTSTTTFNCSAHGPSNPFPEEALAVCCDLDKRFCTTTLTTTATSTMTTSTVTTEPFQCTSGSVAHWPENKTAWCCDQYHLGCPVTTTTKPAPFNCSDLEPSQWSTEKQAWCCNNYQKGCSLSSVNKSRTHPPSTTTPALYKYTGCGEAVTCELRLNGVIHDNLGGKGPDRIEPPIIRYGDVCSTEDGAIDLVIAVDGDYEPFNSLDNGKSAWGPYGAIDVKLGTTVNLRATFMSAGTSTPVKVASVLFSVFGLHQHSPAHEERVTVHSFDSFHVSADSYVHHEQLADGAVFTSSNGGDSLEVAGDPLHCSKEQEKSSVSLLFRDVSSFTFSLALAGQPAEGGRDFLFGGRSCITEHCGGAAAHASVVADDTEGGDRFDCQHGDKEAWPSDQKDWCCSHRSVACGNPYDCNAGFASWRLGWSQVKMDWCCEHKKRGCQFDCDVAYGNWKAAWSDRKKDWCCQHEHRGCRTTSIPSGQYDCNAQRSSWTPEQQQWCCQHQRKGCSAASAAAAWDPFDCDKDFGSWQSSWSHPKKQWCCANFNRGCQGTTPEPFDCTDGFDHWQVRWEPPKKEWCCHNYNRGCADIVQGYERLRPLAARLSGPRAAAVLALGGLGALALLLAAGLRQSRLPPLLERCLPSWRLGAYTQLGGCQVEGELAARSMQGICVEEAPP